MLKQNGQCTQALAKKDGWSAIRRSLVSSACYEDEQWEVAVSLLILQWLIPENFGHKEISFVLFCLFDWHSTVWRMTLNCVERDTQLCDEGHSTVWNGTLNYVERDTQLCDEGHSTVWRGTLNCVERDTELCGEGHSTVWGGTLSCVGRDTHSTAWGGTLNCVGRGTTVWRGTLSCVDRDTQLCGEGHSTVWRGTLCFSLLSIKLSHIYNSAFELWSSFSHSLCVWVAPCQLKDHTVETVSYTHLTLPTNAEV